MAGAPVVQLLIDHQAGNDGAGKGLEHPLESGGIVDRRAVRILQQRLTALVADRQARVTGFNDVAIAAQRLRVRRQVRGENASDKTDADK